MSPIKFSLIAKISIKNKTSNMHASQIDSESDSKFSKCALWHPWKQTSLESCPTIKQKWKHCLATDKRTPTIRTLNRKLNTRNTRQSFVGRGHWMLCCMRSAISHRSPTRPVWYRAETLARLNAASWPKEECSTSNEDMAATAVQYSVYKLEAAITQLLQLIHSRLGHGSRKAG